MHCFPIILHIFSLFYSFRSTFPWSIWQDGGLYSYLQTSLLVMHLLSCFYFLGVSFSFFSFFFTYLSQLVPVLGPFPTSLLEESGSLNRHGQTKATIVYHGNETPFVQVLPTYKLLPSTHQSPHPLQNTVNERISIKILSSIYFCTIIITIQQVAPYRPRICNPVVSPPARVSKNHSG